MSEIRKGPANWRGLFAFGLSFFRQADEEAGAEPTGQAAQQPADQAHLPGEGYLRLVPCQAPENAGGGSVCFQEEGHREVVRIGDAASNEAGADDVDPESASGMSAPQALAIGQHGGFCGGIGGRAGQASVARDGTDQRDLARTPRQHAVQRRMDGVQHPGQIDIKDAAHCCLIVTAGDTGIGDHQIQRRGIVHCFDPGAQGRGVGHVQNLRSDFGASVPACLYDGSQSRRIASAQGKHCSGSRTGPGECFADTAGRAGDQDGCHAAEWRSVGIGASLPIPGSCLSLNSGFGWRTVFRTVWSSSSKGTILATVLFYNGGCALCKFPYNVKKA